MEHVSTLDRTMMKTQEWLQEIKDEGRYQSDNNAHQVLRAVLQALRDRLFLEEVADLGAQLPTYIRGIYYEGWVPSQTPLKIRTQRDFVDRVGSRLPTGMDPLLAVKTIFTILQRKITGGEIQDIKGNLPEHILQLWPAEV